MKYHRKFLLIKQLSQRVRQTIVSKLPQGNQERYARYFQTSQNTQIPHNQYEQQDISEEFQEQEQQEKQGDEEFSMLEYISSLPVKMRQQFRKSNPQLPDIFFMTKQQKKKYFESINQNFKNKLSKTPQRKSKTKKILKFKNDFEVKPFNQEQKVVAVSKSKQIYESYKPNIHFS